MQKKNCDELRELNRLYREKDAIFNSVAVRAGMTDTMFWVLYVLCNNSKKMTQADITNAWYFPRQTIHSVVKRLRAEGFVILEHIAGMRADKAVVLTEQGRAFCDAHVYPLMEAEQKSFYSLTPEERSSFTELLRKQNQLYREYSKDI